jgi:hypothetical protein
MGDNVIENPGGGNNTGNAGARMSACANQVEALEVLTSVVGPEPGALADTGFETKAGALEGIESILEIQWRQNPRGDYVVRKPR